MIPNISNRPVIIAFKRGVKDRDLVRKLATRKIQMFKELFELADKFAKRSKAQAHTKNPQSGKDKLESSKTKEKRASSVTSIRVQT